MVLAYVRNRFFCGNGSVSLVRTCTKGKRGCSCRIVLVDETTTRRGLWLIDARGDSCTMRRCGGSSFNIIFSRSSFQDTAAAAPDRSAIGPVRSVAGSRTAPLRPYTARGVEDRRFTPVVPKAAVVPSGVILWVNATAGGVHRCASMIGAAPRNASKITPSRARPRRGLA